MNGDALESTLRETLREDVAASLESVSGLEQRIVAELEGRLPRPGALGAIRMMIAPSRAGRVGQLAVVAATAAAFLVVGWLAGDRLPGVRQNDRDVPPTALLTAQGASRPVDGLVLIVPALNARSVSVVGSFNEWEPMQLSDDDGDGIWTATLPLPPGRYEYAFIIDGRWWGQDPLADEYVRSFGEFSSVRYVVGGGDGV